jgi:hypothetical protein
MRDVDRMWAVKIAGLIVTITLTGACTTTSTPQPGSAASSPTTTTASPSHSERPSSVPSHLAPMVVIFMENHERSDVLGSSSAPYERRLLTQGRDYVNYFAVTHPSLPNYLAFASGSTNGKASDEIVAGELSLHPTLWDQLTASSVSWAVYEETMPSACYGQDAAGTAPADYALKHNPATPFRSVYSDPAECSNVQPLSSMEPAHLPSFSFIAPNECNDGHSCELATSDGWLAQQVPSLVAAGADVVVTYDEGGSDLGLGGSSGGGHVFAVEVGPGVPAGSVVARPLNHYSLLAGIEARFGMPPIGAAAQMPAMPL